MNGATGVGQENAHHGLATHEVVLLLETDVHRGLSEGEAERRLLRFGPNVLPEARTAGPLARLARRRGRSYTDTRQLMDLVGHYRAVNSLTRYLYGATQRRRRVAA